MWTILAFCAAALGPEEIQVQGLYEGTLGKDKVEARVVALGNAAYKVHLRLPLEGGKVEKIELDGRTEGDKVSFTGRAGDAECSAAYAAGGAIQGTCGARGALVLRRVQRKPPTLGKQPPPGATVLLDGKDFSRMTKGKTKDGKEQEWMLGDDGSIQVPKGGMRSAETFEGSLLLHVEFMNPFMPAARGQARGNSGCFLPNGQEIQVLDSFGTETYTGGGCGGLYKYKDPDAFDVFSLASLPPGEWQTYDVEYRVSGGKAFLTVLHNGIKIHDNHELRKPARKGNFHFQDHKDAVRYRNIWVLPVK